MKLFELRPEAAMLITSTPSVWSRAKPAPQPDSSVTVESPTRTMRSGDAAWVWSDASDRGLRKAAVARSAAAKARLENTLSMSGPGADYSGGSRASCRCHGGEGGDT